MLARRRDEEGSLLVALAVVLVLTTLSIGLLARALSALASARQGQAISTAEAAAAAGLQDAAYVLDHDALASPPPAAVPSGAPRSGVLPDGASYQWRATLKDADTYQVISTGTADGLTHSLRALAHRRPLYPDAILGQHGIALDGASAAAGAIFAGPGGGPPDPERTATIASAHTIVITNGSSVGGGGDNQVTFPAAGSCSGCSHPESSPAPPAAAPVTVPPDPQPGDCPGHGHVDGGTLLGGTYVCRADLILTGDVNVSATPDNPVVIYVVNDSLRLVNLAMSPTGDPSELIIHLVGPGRVDVGAAPDTVAFTGILDAPSATLVSSDCGLSIVGSLVLDTFSCSGARPFSLAYPNSVEAFTAGWTVADVADSPTGVGV